MPDENGTTLKDLDRLPTITKFFGVDIDFSRSAVSQLFKRAQPVSRNSVLSPQTGILLYKSKTYCFLFYFNVISGCDDLLPILSFVIIRSGMAQLVSECDAMEEFIPEG